MTIVASLSPMPKLQFFDGDGVPLSGGRLYTAAAGTPSIPKATYTDATGMVPNANPIVLDSAGRASIWIEGYYYMELWTGDKYEAGSTKVWDMDNVSPLAGASQVPSGAISKQKFSGDGETIQFVLTDPVASEANIQVFVEGIYQGNVAVDDRILTFPVPPPLGVDNVEVVTSVATSAYSTPQDSGPAYPLEGTWTRGWVRWNTSPLPGGVAGWICTESGTPGTWKEFGVISL